MMAKPLLLISSHAVALLLGWFVFGGADAGADLHNPDMTGRKPRPARASETQEGRRLLEEMRREWGTAAAAGAQQVARERPRQVLSTRASMMREHRERQAEELEEIHRRSLAIILPADPAAELARLADGPEIRDTAAFAIAWLRADPLAALEFLDGAEVLIRNSNMTRALNLWAAEAGADVVEKMLEVAPKWQAKLVAALLQVTAAEDPARLDGLLERMEGEMDRGEMIAAAFATLPESRRDAALDWILTSLKGAEAGRATMRMALGMDDEAAAKVFLTKAVAELDPDAVRTLKSWGNYGDIMRSGVEADAPMEQRIEARLAGGIIGKSEEERRANASASLIYEDVSQWVHAEHLREALKAGHLAAADLWRDASLNFAQHAGTDREGLLRAVLYDAVHYDPAGAVKLLADLGHSDEAGSYVLRAVEYGFHRDVERSLAAVGHLQEEALRRNLEGFDRLYRSRIPLLAAERGGFWTGWVRQQPEGLNKDLLLHYTARHHFENGGETLGNELKALVRDPTVRSWPKL